MKYEVLLGNQAIALGLVEQGCRVVTSYPGTPSSEILAGVVKFQQRLGRDVYTEWSINEKVAFETALACSWSGLRSAVAMKQVGLNVASDPLFSAAYTGVRAGLVVIPADDPGPFSSQTEQDSRLTALTAKVPVFDPSSPLEARAMIRHAFELSERFRMPVMVRPTTRLCHACQAMSLDGDGLAEHSGDGVQFLKDPSRWAATPRLRYRLHVELSDKLRQVETAFAESSLNAVLDGDVLGKVGVIASGVAFHTAREALRELGVAVPALKIGTPYPLPQQLVRNFVAAHHTVVVLEEPDACIELQLPDRSQVHGRLDGTVPAAGELAPEVISEVLAHVLTAAGYEINRSAENPELQAFVSGLSLPVRAPRLCPGCPHRSAFFALKREFGAKTIFPSDIGCYTLGVNMGAVDTCVDMGASVSMASGFYLANRLGGNTQPIVATIGDSTFLHSGIAPLLNAVHTGARFVLVILDNQTTAMTGFQPTPASGTLADGSPAARQVGIAGIVRGCGVAFVEPADPYDHSHFRGVLRRAYQHSQAPEGGVAVVIAERPCTLHDAQLLRQNPLPVAIAETCDGCRYCLEAFGCPALVLRTDGSRVDIEPNLCVACGQCISVCPKGSIVAQTADS